MPGSTPTSSSKSILRQVFPAPPKVCALHSVMEDLVETSKHLASQAQKDALSATVATKESSAALDRARVSYLDEMNKISTKSKEIIDELVTAVNDLKKSVARLSKAKR